MWGGAAAECVAHVGRVHICTPVSAVRAPTIGWRLPLPVHQPAAAPHAAPNRMTKRPLWSSRVCPALLVGRWCGGGRLGGFFVLEQKHSLVEAGAIEAAPPNFSWGPNAQLTTPSSCMQRLPLDVLLLLGCLGAGLCVGRMDAGWGCEPAAGASNHWPAQTRRYLALAAFPFPCTRPSPPLWMKIALGQAPRAHVHHPAVRGAQPPPWCPPALFPRFSFINHPPVPPI